VKIKLAPELSCPTCGAHLLMSASVPHPRFRCSTFTHNLCPRCNVDDAAAQGLLALFAWAPVVDAVSSRTFVRLVQEWVQQNPDPPVVSPEAFEADVEAFYRGDFDT
jgi:hypothetical protein